MELDLTGCIIAFVMALFFVALGRLVWDNCFFGFEFLGILLVGFISGIALHF